MKTITEISKNITKYFVKIIKHSLQDTHNSYHKKRKQRLCRKNYELFM